MQKMQCENCGGAIENINDKYCSYCGSLLHNNKAREERVNYTTVVKITSDDIYDFSEQAKKQKYPKG